jgi:NifU-like protein involved in Fe-S cluster formation
VESLYNLEILRLAASIPHLEPLEDPGATASCASRVCGSRVTASVCLDAAGRVQRFGQHVKACAVGQASAALLGRSVIGRSMAELELAEYELAGFLLSNGDHAGEWPDLHLLSAVRSYPSRHEAALLPFRAAKAAVRAALEVTSAR